MAIPIRVWENIKRPFGRSDKLELYAEGYFLDYDAKSDRCLKISSEELFSNSFFFTYPALDMELLPLFVSQLSNEQMELLSENIKKHCLFWKSFDKNRIVPGEFKTAPNLEAKYLIRIEPDAVHYLTEQGKSYKKQRFDNFLFKGSELPGLNKETRLMLRQMLFDCLGQNPPFSTEACFPIFDYEKVLTHDQTIQTDMSGGGEDFVYVQSNGIVRIGGWDRGGAGYIDYSVEQIWSNHALIPSKFDKEKILAAIGSGLIQSPKSAPPA